MIMDPFHLIRRHLQSRREMLLDHLGSGAPRNMEEYRQIVGSLTEISLLEQEIAEIERRFVDE